MMMEFQREPISVSEAAITAIEKAYTEVDIIVPDVRPDIAKVLQADANAVILSKECASDKVTVEGRLVLSILYLDENNGIVCINSTQNFSHTAAMSGAMPEMAAELSCDVENVEYEVLNSRKINIRVTTGIDLRVVMPLDIEVITNVGGGEYETLKRKIQPYSTVARFDECITVRDRLEIPSGKPSVATLLKQDARVKSSEVKLTSGKLILKGILEVTTLYLGDMEEHMVQCMEHELPFTEIIDVPALEEGMMVDIDFQVQSLEQEIQEDSDGDCRILLICAQIGVTGKVYKNPDMEIIQDIYSTCSNLQVKKETAMVDRLVADESIQCTLSDTAAVDADMPEITQIYQIIAKPYLTGTRIEGDAIVVEGVIDAYILYLSGDPAQPLCTHRHEQNFVQSIQAEGASDDMLCNIRLGVEHVNYHIGLAREVQLRLILSVGARVICTDKVEYVTDIQEEECEEQAQVRKCCIKIYFVQKGDDLWNIAKKYRTTGARIMDANNIADEGEITAGKQLIIP